MTQTQTASERITEEVTSWPGVAAGPGRRGEFSFRVGRREVGHLHGDRSAHFALPADLAERLREQGRVGPHPAFPEHPKMAARRLDADDDVRDVIAIMRDHYDRIVARYGLPPTDPS
jgi:hypothetical protein